MMYSLRMVSKEITGDAKSRTVTRELIKRGILHRNGVPNKLQLDRGNFTVHWTNAIQRSKYGAFPYVMVTEKGMREIRKMMAGMKHSDKEVI